MRKVKLTVNLSQACIYSVKEIAKERGCTMTQVIYDALKHYLFLRQEISDESKILVEQDGKILQVLLQ